MSSKNRRHKFPFRVIAFVIGTLLCIFAGDRYFPTSELEFWGFIIFAFLVLLPPVAMFPSVRKLGYKHDASPCLKKSTHCCVEPFKVELAEKLGSSLTIDDDTMREFKLTSNDSMIQTFSLFTSKNKEDARKAFIELIKDDNISDDRLNTMKREIWFFSSEVSSESFIGNVQALLHLNEDGFDDISLLYFYIDSQNQTSATEREKVKIKEMNPKTTPQYVLMNFESKEESESKDETINLLPSLLSSVIFIFRSEEETSYASFFALKGKEKESVYFRMPLCMNEDYYEYFASLKNGNPTDKR
jgi:hypothetical protein